VRIRFTAEDAALPSVVEAAVDDFAVDALTCVPPCLADFNREDGVTLQDIFDFIGGFFGQDPAADINRSGSVTVQDIFDFLAAYFAGCP
jgi:hypothetical protein